MTLSWTFQNLNGTGKKIERYEIARSGSQHNLIRVRSHVDTHLAYFLLVVQTVLEWSEHLRYRRGHGVFHSILFSRKSYFRVILNCVRITHRSILSNKSEWTLATICKQRRDIYASSSILRGQVRWFDHRRRHWAVFACVSASSYN